MTMRPRGLVLVLCGVLGLGGLAGGAVGCGEDEPPPVRVARKFALAVGMGDMDQVLALVDGQTAARVQQAAERASDQVGGRRNIEPREMLQVVDVDPRSLGGKAELVQPLAGDEQRAVVALTGLDGTSHTLELIQEHGEWRVHLPLPRGPMVEP
ncbi:hypothetical protein [Paraliomyxa miuraensis]|uniref:hypothetical protein n=1 Tax=Paraliomyxa miuraensis TaxID=376150 RepID=UPI0022572B51|nr:hypothetical protein [Paraliomyxa miuraensis]MCX4242782.1 hypothetical protein [Paraliomyxa miuraensis]